MSTILTTRRFALWWRLAREWFESKFSNIKTSTPYITMDGSSVVFNYFTPRQMEKVYIWLEGGNLWFELTKDEEGQYSLTTKCDIQELDGMFVMGGEEHDLDTIVDTIPVYLKGYKVSEVRIEGIDADLLNADFTWKLAEIGNKLDNIKLPEIDTTELAKQGDNPDATNSAIYDAIWSIRTDQQLIQECYDVAEEKYATMPRHKTLANLPNTLQTINATEQGNVDVSALTIASKPECEYINFYGIYFNDSFPVGSFNSYLRAVYNIRGYASGWVNAFFNSPNVETITFNDFTTRGTNFLRAENIKQFDMTGLYIADDATGTYDGVFYPTLTTLIGSHTLEDVLKGLAVLHNNHISLKLSQEVLLRREDFRAVINGLKDLTGQDAKTLTLGSTNLAKLTAEDIAVATNKNWTLA